MSKFVSMDYVVAMVKGDKGFPYLRSAEHIAELCSTIDMAEKALKAEKTALKAWLFNRFDGNNRWYECDECRVQITGTHNPATYDKTQLTEAEALEWAEAEATLNRLKAKIKVEGEANIKWTVKPKK